MEYSIYDLNKKILFSNLTVSSMIDKLNFIGFEVDDLSFENQAFCKFSVPKKILLKIPANRSDLLSQEFFVHDFCTIFNLKSLSFFSSIKNSYNFLYEKKLNELTPSISFSNKENEIFSNMFLYKLKINFKKEFISPLWIQSKLKLNFLKVEGNFFDILRVVEFEWGQSFQVFQETSFDSSTFLIQTFFSQEKINFQNENLKKKLFDKNILESSSITKDKISSFEIFQKSISRFLTLLELSGNPLTIEHIKIIDNLKSFSKKEKILKLKKISAKFFFNKPFFNKAIFLKFGLKIVCETPNCIYFQIPHYRKDLTREIDLIEEYSRFFGFENISEIFPKKKEEIKKINTEPLFLKEFLLNRGFNEIISTPLQSNLEGKKNYLELTNPLNLESTSLRKSLLPGILNVFLTNFKNNNEIENIFEIGHVFQKKGNQLFETEKLAFLFQLNSFHQSKNSETNWFFAKSLIENYFCCFFDESTFQKIPTHNISLNLFNQKRKIFFSYENLNLGVFGELNSNIRKKYHLKSSIYLTEINLSLLEKKKKLSSIPILSELKLTPIIKKDISIIVEKTINFSILKKNILEQSRYLKNCEFFDLFFDQKQRTEISIGIRLEFQSLKETLTIEKIEKEISTILLFLKSKFNIKLKIN